MSCRGCVAHEIVYVPRTRDIPPIICSSTHVIQERRSPSLDPPKDILHARLTIIFQTVKSRLCQRVGRQNDGYIISEIHTHPSPKNPANHRCTHSFMRQRALHKDVACHIPRRVERWCAEHVKHDDTSCSSFLCFLYAFREILHRLCVPFLFPFSSHLEPPGLEPRRDANLIG